VFLIIDGKNITSPKVELRTALWNYTTIWKQRTPW